MEARSIEKWWLTSDGRISHFTKDEFYRGLTLREKGEAPAPLEELIDRLEWLRSQWNDAIIITSGIRSFRSNKEAKGSPRSLHLLGGAADLKVGNRVNPTVKGWEMVLRLEHATRKGTEGRYGIYSQPNGGHAHLDVDTERSLRRWVKVGDQLMPLEDFVEEHWPGVTIPGVPISEANQLLGW